MKKVILLRGLPASGKSTYAKQLLDENKGMYKRINRDALREMLDNYQFSNSNEQFIKRCRNFLIKEALEAGKHVIVDDTNLSEKAENQIRAVVKEYTDATGQPIKVEIKEFDTDVETCIKRDALRARSVGRKVIMGMYNKYYKNKTAVEERGPNYSAQDENLPKAIVCDLDGTLAILNGRNPYDASKCDEDLLNAPVFEIVKNYQAQGDKIILLSGRSEQYKEPTLRWLEKYDIQYDALVMRPIKDQRKDAIVKREFYDENIKDQYYVRFVLDDRNQVVDMWRKELGLPCLQVNYGDF